MTLTFCSGDPLLTKQQILAIGINAAGRSETTPLAMALFDRYPAAFATYGKQCRQGKIKPGMIWFWRAENPALAFMVVRETPVGATRLRFVEAAIMALVRDYRVENIHSVALAPLGASHEAEGIREVLNYWLPKSALPVIAYNDYQPGVAAEN